MKKIYFLFTSVLASIAMQAQLTQANHAANVGDTYQMYQCDSAGISPGAAGASALWDFSARTTHSSVLQTYNGVAVSNASYPSATVAVGSGTSNVSFYNSDANTLRYYGGTITVGSIAVALVYTAPAIQAAYPMSLNTATNNTIGGSLTASGLPGTFTGNSSVIADGTGTLILPGSNATFTSATRVVTSQTINFSAGFVSGSVTQVNYDYFVTGIKAPAYSISTSTLVNTLAPTSTQALVFRNKNAVLTATTTVGVKESKNADALVMVYPNPCNNAISFKLQNYSNAKLQVLDLTGKTIEMMDLSGDKLNLSTANYNNGLYFYKIQNAEGESLSTGKFTVSH